MPLNGWIVQYYAKCKYRFWNNIRINLINFTKIQEQMVGQSDYSLIFSILFAFSAKPFMEYINVSVLI